VEWGRTNIFCQTNPFRSWCSLYLCGSTGKWAEISGIRLNPTFEMFQPRMDANRHKSRRSGGSGAMSAVIDHRYSRTHFDICVLSVPWWFNRNGANSGESDWIRPLKRFCETKPCAWRARRQSSMPLWKLRNEPNLTPPLSSGGPRADRRNGKIIKRTQPVCIADFRISD
jgi:hypothetical protein